MVWTRESWDACKQLMEESIHFISINTYHLLSNHDDSLDGELAVAVIEQVLQARTEKVNDQNVVEALLAKVINIRDPGYTSVSLDAEYRR